VHDVAPQRDERGALPLKIQVHGRDLHSSLDLAAASLGGSIAIPGGGEGERGDHRRGGKREREPKRFLRHHVSPVRGKTSLRLRSVRRFGSPARSGGDNASVKVT